MSLYTINFFIKGGVLSNNYIEQFKGVEAGPLIQFVKYGISGGLATFVPIRSAGINEASSEIS